VKNIDYKKLQFFTFPGITTKKFSIYGNSRFNSGLCHAIKAQSEVWQMFFF